MKSINYACTVKNDNPLLCPVGGQREDGILSPEEKECTAKKILKPKLGCLSFNVVVQSGCLSFNVVVQSGCLSFNVVIRVGFLS